MNMKKYTFIIIIMSQNNVHSESLFKSSNENMLNFVIKFAYYV